MKRLAGEINFIKNWQRRINTISGTIAGGRKTRETNYKKHGKDFYKRIGAIGGRRGSTGGFYANRALASIAGAMGGRVSKRGYKLVGEKDGQKIYRKDGKDYTIEDVKAELEAKYGKRS